MLSSLLSILTFFAALVHHQCIAQGFWPAAFPLAVRTPYLNSWLDARASVKLPNQWPRLWDLSHIFGHTVIVRIDGSSYLLIGETGANLTSLSDVIITPTQTSLIIPAGTMLVNLTYLSPIETQNLALQSFPFSYIYLSAQSTDGNAHSVQFYTDVSGEWTSGDVSNSITWNTTQTSQGVLYHECQRSAYQSMQEINNLAEDPTLYYATGTSNLKMTYQSGRDADVRGLFTTNGTLANTQDTSFRAINDNFPVFGFAWDAGTMQSLSAPIVWAIGVVRDPAILYTTSSGNQTRSSMFFTKFKTVQAGIENFLSDFSNAQSRAAALDQKLTAAATAVSPNYANLVALTTRMTMAGIETTVSKSGNTYNMSDIMMFMKDIGNSRRTNPVETLYAAFPTFLYLNASWAGYLLEPLLRYETELPSGKPFSRPDLGSTFPAATGNASPTIFRAIEDSSSMLIMAWAHARFSGDASLLERYYSLFKSWTDYLVTNTLTPTGFTTADGLDNTNMTNLALKGIVGIRTMAEISKALGNSDSSDYQSKATSYAQQWTTLASPAGHVQSTYDSTSSWALIYNLFPDQLLGLNLIDKNVYNSQSSWYTSEASSAGTFGLPFDSTQGSVAKAPWTMFTAASMTDSKTRNLLINEVYQKANSNSTPGVFPTTYDITTGNSTSGMASPAQGAVLAILSLSLKAQSVSGHTSNSASSSTNKTAAIVGGAVGGAVFLAILFTIFFLIWRKRRYHDRWEDQAPSGFMGFNSHQHLPSGVPLTEQYTGQETQPHSQYPMSHRSQPSCGSSYEATSTSRLNHGPSSRSRSEAPPLPRKGSDGLVYMNPPSQSGQDLADTMLPNSDATMLRTEVENLRREMDEMRAQGHYQPPPQYQ